MTSKSRAAQEKLVELENDSAPFEEQVLEAARFIGVDLEHVGRSLEQIHDLSLKSKALTYHGREEWLLRWLLKKLQAPKDDVPRKTASSWLLFSCLIEKIPEPNVARMLSEKKFMTILRQTLEEAQKIDSNTVRVKNTSDFTPINSDKSSKVSKKRKRTGELVSASDLGNHGTQDLLAAVLGAISYIISATKVVSEISEEESPAAFSAEYMKSVIKTQAEDAAKILGTWLSLSRTSLIGYKTPNRTMSLWLSPFIEIWDSRTMGNEDLIQFSLYCSPPLLSLLEIMKSEGDVFDWKDELEQLIARNIIVPAKAEKMEKADSDLLTTLTRISVIQDSANAPTLFEVAIRSIQPHGSRRRRPNDDAWLQAVFDTLREAMPPQRAEENGKAVKDMLECAINYKVEIDLSTLRSIASDYGLLNGKTSWSLLAMIIELDTNVFLIPNGEKDLLQEILKRITTACFEPTWSNLSMQVIGDVVVPLMNGFAKARDLLGFIHHWYDQLVYFERLRMETGQSSMAIFSAWEDDTLQIQLSNIMESSLTVPQIVQLIDWLSSQITKNPDAVCLILDAVAGSIFQEDVIDALEIRSFRIIFDNDISKKLNRRYKWRSWRILSRTLNWTTPSGHEELSFLWEKNAAPFDSLYRIFGTGSLLNVVDGNMVELETLEAVRFLCAAWNIAKEGTNMEVVARKLVLDILQSLAQDIKLQLQDPRSNQELGEEKCGSALNTLCRGIGWMLWSCINCVLVEYPRVLQLGLELKGPVFGEFLQSIFWIASIPHKDSPSSDSSLWLRINHEAFATTWNSMLNNDHVLSNTALISRIIDILIDCQNNQGNPLVKSPANNAFTVQCLLQLPLEVFSRKDREHIMKGWLPVIKLAGEGSMEKTSYESTALDSAVLSLKVKVMQRPTVYEGMKYQDLVNLADSLASAEFNDLDINLGLFKELVKRTMSHITANLDQPRNREYTLDALKHLQKKVKVKTDSKKGSKLNHALIILFEALLGVLAEKETQLNDLKIIISDDLSDITESFKNILLAQKFKKSRDSGKEFEKAMAAIATVDALTTLKVDGLELAKFADSVKLFTSSLNESNSNKKKWLETFISAYTHSSPSEILDLELGGDVSSVFGRQTIMEKAQTLIGGKDEHEKLTLLKSVLHGSPVDSMALDKILALRFIVTACEDARPEVDEDDEDDSFDLSTVHSMLCSHLWKGTSTRQFCLISETLVMMFRTKSRAMTQWNIDSALGSITVACSRHGPVLRSTRAGTIYMHLCRLMQAILTSHRLKLQGHLHLVVQVMQALLRCLFRPLPHSTTKTTTLFALPPWLSSPKFQLEAPHGAAFTRLVTLICDPSVSSVTRSKHHNLTSATDTAKRMAGQHMQFVLMTYIQLQLEMKMLPEIRETMVPGLYAIFDTSTPEMRRMIGDSLDSSGRALFGTLFRDYQKFGKWKGS